jgi:UTP:GlnB (protein PII) uridylyltransferase
MHLSDDHKRALVNRFDHLKSLISEVEALAQTTQQKQGILDYCTRVRSEMEQVYQSLDLPQTKEQPHALRDIQVLLEFARVAVDEADPKRLTGFGPLQRDESELIRKANSKLYGVLTDFIISMSKQNG